MRSTVPHGCSMHWAHFPPGASKRCLGARYAEHGFIVNNEDVQGSIMCMGTLSVAWDVARLEDVTLDSLALLDVVRPAPGIRFHPLRSLVHAESLSWACQFSSPASN